MTRKRWIRDLALGAAAFCVLFACTEGVLRLGGWGKPERVAGGARGFDRAASYLVPDPEQAGAWFTQFADRMYPETRIAPKSDATRIVLLGGSNAFHFPVEHLAAQLNTGGAAEFEVVNLGRRGYGSERVSVIAEQALEVLEPDIVVIYSGHNEFVERGFKQDLERHWSSAVARLGQRALSESHAVALLEQALRSREVHAATKPEAWKSEYAKFKELQYDETLRYYAEYERNLARICDAALARGVRVILCTVIHNRLSAPFCSPTPPDWSDAERRTFEELRSTAAAAIPSALRALLPQVEEERLHHMNWLRRKRGEDVSERVGSLPGRRPSSGALAGRDPLLGAHWRSDPKVWRLYEALDVLWSRDFPAPQIESLHSARSALLGALELASRHPATLFELAVVEFALGADGSRVRRLFEQSARLDSAPRNASGATNERVQRVAARRPGVRLLDADGLFVERVPLGLVGWEWMLDHCHLNGGAGQVVMEDLAASIAELGDS